MTKAWKVIEEQYYEKFRIFSAKRSRRENPRTGKPFDFFLMEGMDWTNTILLTPENNIVLVEQYRQGADRVTIELPGGAVEPDEDVMKAASREVLEETGFAVSEMNFLGSAFANPAMQSMKLHIFLGRTLDRTPQPQQLDSEEDIRIIVKPIDEFLEDVRQGKAEHALTVAAIGMYLLNRPR